MMKTHHLKPNVEGVVVEVNPLERLTQFWEQMDSIGLQNVIVENLKKVSSFWKGQLSVALGSVHNSPFLGFSKVGHRRKCFHQFTLVCLIAVEELLRKMSPLKFKELDIDNDGKLSVKELEPAVANIEAALRLPPQGCSPDFDHIYTEELHIETIDLRFASL
ncbi:unnamed protein product [Amaranthus hypochondriacus]